MAALDKLGVETSSVLAFLGAVGLAVGLALKETLGDAASGIMLLARRPFVVGDSVDIGGNVGTIAGLDVFETELIRTDGVPVIIPNSKIRSGEIRNFTRARRRRADLHVRVSYDEDLGRAIEVIHDAIRRAPTVLEEPTPLVDAQELGENAVRLLVRVWTSPDEHIEKTLQLTRQIKDRLEEAGFAPPIPRREIRVIEEGAIRTNVD